MISLLRSLSPVAVMAASISLLAGCAPIAPIQPIDQTDIMQDAGPDAEAIELQKREDQLFADAKSTGKVVLVVPTASLDSLNTDFQNNDSTMEFLKLRSAVTEWTNTQDSTAQFKVGYDTQKTAIGSPQGSYFQVVFGRTLYKIYLIDPGHYTISGVSYDVPRTSAYEPPGDHGIRASSLGYITLSPKSFAEYDRGERWEDASYTTDTVQEERCTAVRVVNGECVSTGKYSYEVQRQTSPAGWRKTIQQRDVEGRTVSAHLSKDFASFDVAAGEVVLIDGFFADPPSFEYKEGSCRQTQQSQMRCELQQVRLVKLIAEVDQVLQVLNAADYGFPKMAEVLKQLTYRPLKVLAKKSTGHSTWGPVYSVQAD
ncbi:MULTISPECIES: hypothetical protein [unclassified Pseudomonas]|uniref:hypothetical protein n=1 Tax=unclassified Pseudomonas TaxID=196821 RepID=UPI000871AFF8|nr:MULTISPECIES: hypothetical protein [unclassified Pseudomonas]SCW99397.1 hypothetical protein SAMN03159481_05559 [Pseudomonas sp. NFACC56-3]SFK99840.1 hypothetical protein SAMN03159473_05156 [Pseudomonas sp. NFACC52]